MQDVCRVEVVFSRQPGGPSITVEDVAVWVSGQLDCDGIMEGYNSLRYSKGRVVSVALIGDDR